MIVISDTLALLNEASENSSITIRGKSQGNTNSIRIHKEYQGIVASELWGGVEA